MFRRKNICEYYLFCFKASQLIYSLRTSLFYHSYSKQVPIVLSITVKQGCKVHKIDTQKVDVRYSTDELLEHNLTATLYSILKPDMEGTIYL